MRVRSAYTQTTLLTLESLPSEQRDQAFARLSASTAAAVRRAGRLGWVDGKAHLELDDALYDTLGRAAYIEHCIELARIWFDRPLVAAFRIALLGDYSPRALLSKFPLTFSVLFKEAGKISLEFLPGGHSARVTHHAVPLLARGNEAWRLGFVGSLRGLLQIGGSSSRVAVDTKRDGLGELTYLIDWKGER